MVKTDLLENVVEIHVVIISVMHIEPKRIHLLFRHSSIHWRRRTWP